MIRVIPFFRCRICTLGLDPSVVCVLNVAKDGLSSWTSYIRLVGSVLTEKCKHVIVTRPAEVKGNHTYTCAVNA